jgi:uncharacterized cofD-like protein
LQPNAHIYTKAYEALVNADKIVFCPGDFWTSLIPNTLVDGFKDALKETKASTIMVTNIMTKKSETDGYTSATFAEKLCEYTGLEFVDVLISNSASLPLALLQKYELEMARPVSFVTSSYAANCMGGDFADITGGIIRHHQRTVTAIAEL